MKDSFIFYRSFFEASKPLNSEQKAELFNAICEFALNQNETKKDPLVEGMFALIKPQLEANNQRYENGKKGGRPITKAKPKRNQNVTKTKPNVNVNVNENNNVNDNNLKKEKEKKIFEEIKKTWNEFKKPEGKVIKNTFIADDEKIFMQCRTISPEIRKQLKILQKTHKEEDYRHAIGQYYLEIISRSPETDYAIHRFSFLQFLRQKNGFQKFYDCNYDEKKIDEEARKQAEEEKLKNEL